MTVYTWPDTRAFQPQGQELRVVDNTQRTAESSLSGYVQTTGMPGARWAWGLDMAPDTRADRAALEAFLLRLSGRQHRVQLWDMRNPRPRGDVVLTGVTLGATAAQFTTTLQLAGCRPQGNRLADGSFEVDSNADGLADAWSLSSSGSTGAVTFANFASVDVHGARVQRMAAAALGTSGSDFAGIQKVTAVAGLVGQAVTVSVYARKVSVGTDFGFQVYLTWLDGVGSPVGADSQTTATPTGLLQRYAVTTVVPVGAVSVRVLLLMRQAVTAGGVSVDVDSVQLNIGAAPADYVSAATLLAGDWLGLSGGQLVRVVADATSNDAGAMTVEVRHMLRSAVASGSAVTLDKPTALYVRTEAGLALPRMPGNVDPGLSIDLVEVFS